MSEIVALFGDYAGAIWHLLQDNGPLSEQELLTRTQLTQPQLYAAIGWLAREDKIEGIMKSIDEGKILFWLK